MSLSSPLFQDPVRRPSGVAPAKASVDFFRDSRALLEQRLVEECGRLGGSLGPLEAVLARAVGTEGRGGGRWRPLLTLVAAEACHDGPRGAGRERALDAAVAVELTHTASLVLDDLPCMDDSSERRGQPATHVLVGSAGAILLSVGLLARAVELLGRGARAGGALCEEWGRAVGFAGMAGGQAMDVAAGDALRGAARRLHREKSTALPAFALSAGARLAGADETSRAGLEAFGRSLGWAYQLLDDERDREEDGIHAAPDAARPGLQSRRIMRRARRQLRSLPRLDDEGFEMLMALAARVLAAPSPVPGEAQPEAPAAPTRSRRA